MTDHDPDYFPPVIGTLPDRLGDYRLLGLLDQSGLGPVFRGEDVRDGTPVTVVVLAPAVASNPEIRERFLREARATARRRPNESDHIIGAQDGWLFYAIPVLPEPTIPVPDLLEPYPANRPSTELETVYVPPATALDVTLPHESKPDESLPPTEVVVPTPMLATLPPLKENSGWAATRPASDEFEPVRTPPASVGESRAVGLSETNLRGWQPQKPAKKSPFGIVLAVVAVVAGVGIGGFLILSRPADPRVVVPDPTPSTARPVEPARLSTPPDTVPSPSATSDKPDPPRLDWLEPSRILMDDRWPVMPSEVVAVIGSSVRQHFGGVGLILPNPDPRGTWVATLNAGQPRGSVFLWNTTDLRPTGRRLTVDGESLTWLAASSDGRTLVAGSATGPATVFDLSGGDAKQPSQFTPNSAGGAAFRPDGILLTAAGRRLTGWDVSGPKPTVRFEADAPEKAEDPVGNVSCSPDGKLAVVNHSQRTVRVWDVSGDKPKGPVELGGPDRFWLGTAFGPDGKTLYTLERAAKGQVRRWQRDGATFVTPEIVVTEDDDSGFLGLAVSPDGRQLAVSTPTGSVLRFDVSGPTAKALPEIDLGYEVGSAAQLAFAPDGKTLYTGNTVLRKWDVSGPDPTEAARFDPANRVTGAMLAANGMLVTANADGKLKVWELSGPEPTVRSTIEAGPSGTSPGRLVVTADGGTAATANGGPDWTSGPTVWRLADRSAKIDRLVYSGTIPDLDLTPDGKTLVATTDRMLVVWVREPHGYTFQSERQPPAHQRWERCAISADGRWIAATASHSVHLFAANGGAAKDELKLPATPSATPVFGPTGTLLVIGKDLERPLCYRLRDGHWKQDRLPDEPDRPKLHEAAFLPDGRSFVASVTRAGGDVPRLEVWDAIAGRKEPSFALPGRTLGLSVAADGRHVCVLNENGTAAIYRLPTRSVASGGR